MNNEYGSGKFLGIFGPFLQKYTATFQETPTIIFAAVRTYNSGEGDNRILQNVRIFLPKYMASHPRRPLSFTVV
jgi:menaquinone-dependent protoporphyrinogen IX oxidase